MLQLTVSSAEDLDDPFEIEIEIEQELETSNLLKLNHPVLEPRTTLDTPLPLDIHLIILEYLTEEDLLVWAKHPQGMHALKKYFIFNATKLTTFIYSGDILKQIEINSSQFEEMHSIKSKIAYSILALAIIGLCVFSSHQLISIGYGKYVRRENSRKRTNHFLLEIQSSCPSIFSNANGCTILPFAIGQDLVCNQSPCEEVSEVFFNNCAETDNLQQREDFSTWGSRYSFERKNGRCAQSIFDRMPICASDKFSAYLDSCPNTLDWNYANFYFAAAVTIVAGLVSLVCVCGCYFMRNQGFLNKPASILAIEDHSVSEVVFKRILKTRDHLTVGELKNLLNENDSTKEQSLSLKHHGLFKLRTISEIRQKIKVHGADALIDVFPLPLEEHSNVTFPTFYNSTV